MIPSVTHARDHEQIAQPHGHANNEGPVARGVVVLVSCRLKTRDIVEGNGEEPEAPHALLGGKLLSKLGRAVARAGFQSRF